MKISRSGIAPLQQIKSEHLLRIIGALDGTVQNTEILVSGSVTASYFIGDGSQLANLPIPSSSFDTSSLVTYSIFNLFTSSYTTGSFTGSFKGDGSQLTGINTSSTGSNFYLSGSLLDAGSNKSSSIERTGPVGGAPATASNHFITKAQFDIHQIKLTTSSSITTLTTSQSIGQHGKNNILDNGASAINLTTDINSEPDFVASYLKHGASAITFLAGSGSTLIQVDGTAVLNGAVGSTATLSRVSNAFYLRISNA